MVSRQAVTASRVASVERSGEAPVVDAGARSRADAAMERYADGDESAFATLYDEVAPRLLRFTSRQLRSAAAAEDVVQQAFLQMHVARGQFTRGAAVLPWAYAIARRLVIDLSRRRGHEDPRAVAEDEGAPSPAAAADDALMARVWSGIHFRFTMLDTRVMAEQVAAYVLQNAAQPCATPSF